MLTRKERKRLNKGLSIEKKVVKQKVVKEKVKPVSVFPKLPPIELHVNDVYTVDKSLLLDTISAFRRDQYAKGLSAAKKDTFLGQRKSISLDECHSDKEMVNIITKISGIDAPIIIAGIMTCFCDRVFAQGYVAFTTNKGVVLPIKKLI